MPHFHSVWGSSSAHVLPACESLAIEDIVMASMDQRLSDADAALAALKTRYESADSQLVAIRDEVFVVLENKGLIEHNVKFVGRAGFHPRNRGKRGITPSEVPNKLAGFKASGFSASLLKPVMVKRSPAERGNTYEQVNIVLCNATASDGMLAPVGAGTLDSFTLTANHSWQALKLAQYSECDPKFKAIHAALNDGLHVIELPWQLEERHPWLIDLIIEADNVPQGIVVNDSTLDLCYKIKNLSQELKRGEDNTTDWDAVEARMKRSAVHRPTDVPFLIEFVRSSCLSPRFDLLDDVDQFSKRLQVVQEVPAKVMGKFESVYLGPSGSPLWRAAVWKAIMRAGSKYVSNGVNTYTTLSDVINMGKSVQLKPVQSAEVIMEQARDTESKSNIPTHVTSDLIDTLGIRLVAHSKRLGEFKSQLAIAGDFYHNMKSNVGATIVDMPNEWILPQHGGGDDADTHANATKNNGKHCVSGTTSACTNVQIVMHMKLRGVEVGSAVIEKVSKEVFKVVKITADQISLVHKDGREQTASPSLFLSLYDKSKTKPEEFFFIGTSYAYMSRICNIQCLSIPTNVHM